MNKFLASFSLLLFVLSPTEAQGQFVLHDGTPVRIRLNRNLSSADAKVGESVDFEVLEDVKVNDVLVIARGCTALGTVTEAVPKRRMARGGKLDVNIDSLRLVDDEKVALRAVKETKGGGHSGAMTGGIVATSIIFFPAAPLFLFMHGKDITIPKGTEITAYVAADVKLDSIKFAPKTATAPPPSGIAPSKMASNGKPITNEDVLSLKSVGLSDELIIAKIKSSPANYSVDTTDIVALKKAGMADTVIQVMIETQSQQK
jgi:hypothetical protein